MSQDGLNWARIEGEHHTGALLDVGEPGEWDELFIASPQVYATCSRSTCNKSSWNHMVSCSMYLHKISWGMLYVICSCRLEI